LQPSERSDQNGQLADSPDVTLPDLETSGMDALAAETPEMEMPDMETGGQVDLLETPPNHRSGFVAVIGRPNVGKSTLLNRLLGQKIAITSPKPQTTRDQLLGIYTTENMQVMFLDTPGIHKPHNKLGEHMVSVAELSVEDADLVLWVVDATTEPTDEDLAIASLLHDLFRRKNLSTPLLIALNKADLADGAATTPEAYTQRLDAYRLLAQSISAQSVSDDDANRAVAATDEATADGAGVVKAISISALHGAGIDELLEMVRRMLPLGPRYYPEDQVTDLQTRFIVGELVREKALSLLQQEVPHSLAVVVDEFTPRDDNMTYISAVIYVERASQKGIVLGRQGRTIKKIGQIARPEIEELVGTRVYLELWVKVWEKWRRREAMLRRLGYAIG
jgi:GTPase